jgi:hypothetical protein
MTFVEVLVAIVLFGTVVIATLTAARVSITGSRIERDHARAHQWLQSAVAALDSLEQPDCLSGEASVRGQYQTHLQTQTISPPGWANTQITVVEPVRFWDGENYLTEGEPGFDCGAASLQLLTIRVRDPDQEIIEEVQVVKG